MRNVWLAGLVCLVAACASEPEGPPPSPDPATARSLAQGDLVGYSASNGAQVWRAIPYAEPPVGPLRWRAPRPALAFEDGFQALTAPPRCPQVTTALDQGAGIEAGLLLGSEDCLYLDVYAPASATAGETSRPVMVWIHGGSNIWGYADQYDATQLVEDQDVVVVVIQYRVGPLGWFSHSALADTAERPEDAAANFALLDMVQALRWVEGNIVQFGGDPERVTIFGESAGGHNVYGLLASPLAAGLFDRAIVQSGSVDTVSFDDARGFTEARVAAQQVTLGLESADVTAQALQAVALEDVFAAYRVDGQLIDIPRMIEDRVTLQDGGIRTALQSTETFNAVPVITGTNRDEMKLFNLFNPALTRKVLGTLYTVRDRPFYDALAEYQSRVWRINAVDRPAKVMQAAGHGDVWAYRFDWDEGGKILVMDLSVLFGAAHSLEIPFVFNNFDFFGRIDGAMFNARNAPGREVLAAAMGGYWAEFARTGDPGTGGGNFPEWSRWDGPARLMRLDSPQAGGQVLLGEPDGFEQLTVDLRDDPRLDAEQRCRIVDAIGRWDVAAQDRVRGGVGC